MADLPGGAVDLIVAGPLLLVGFWIQASVVNYVEQHAPEVWRELSKASAWPRGKRQMKWAPLWGRQLTELHGGVLRARVWTMRLIVAAIFYVFFFGATWPPDPFGLRTLAEANG